MRSALKWAANAALTAVFLAGIPSVASAEVVCGLKPNDPILNVRTCPKTSCAVKFGIVNLTHVDVISSAKGGWKFVEVHNKRGYVNGKFLCLQGDVDPNSATCKSLERKCNNGNSNACNRYEGECQND